MNRESRPEKKAGMFSTNQSDQMTIQISLDLSGALRHAGGKSKGIVSSRPGGLFYRGSRPQTFDVYIRLVPIYNKCLQYTEWVLSDLLSISLLCTL
jgi:hypothetical protein